MNHAAVQMEKKIDEPPPNPRPPVKRQCGSRQCDDDLDELLTTEAGKQKLIAELRGDYFAAGLAISRSAQGNTWADYHRRWFLSEVPVVPLTMEKLEAVGPASRIVSTGASTTT